MTKWKRKITVLDTIVEEPSGKRQCTALVKYKQATQTDSPKSLPTSSSGNFDLPEYVKPAPNFLGVFSRVKIFADGLRQCGGLDRFDYTNLRMACKTTASELKPYPYSRLRPDAKNTYFAGIKLIPCDRCKISSNKLVVKPCGGPFHPKGHVPFMCMYCAMERQREHKNDRQDSEMHYCRRCSEDLHSSNAVTGSAELCGCDDFDGYSRDILDLSDSHWLCGDCLWRASEHSTTFARRNLKVLEALGGVCARDDLEDPNNGLRRWIAPGSNESGVPLNRCPGCKCNYGELVESWRGTRLLQPTRMENTTRLPKGMMVQCLVCLRQKRPRGEWIHHR